MPNPRTPSPNGELMWKQVDPDRLADDRLAVTVAIGALLFLTVGVGQLVFDSTPGVVAPSILALVTGTVLGITALLLWRRPDLVTPGNARILVTGTAIIVIINPIAYIVSTHVAYPAIGTLLVIVGIGALVPYPRIAIVLIVIVNVIAALFAVRYPQSATVGSVLLQLFKADMSALVIALAWRRTENRLQLANETIRQMADTDPLTGVLNRRGFWDRSDQVIMRADAMNAHVVLGFIDLDGLKVVNDVFGHAAGDEALASVGAALSLRMADGDLAARIGGDEFALVSAISDAAEIPRFTSGFEAELDALTHPLTVGWAVREPDSAVGLGELLIEADRAMRARRT